MRIKQLLESASVGGMSTGNSVATVPGKAGKMQRRQGNLFAAEGSEFGAYYSEQVAQQIFNKRQDITSEDEVLNQAYHIVANEQGQKTARYKFNYDEDFPSEVVSNYFWLQKQQGVAEAEIDRPGMKDGRPYSDPYRRHPGNSSYMTPEYLIQKYKERLEQIAAGPYKRPKEVAQLQSRIAKLEKKGVAEGELDEACWKDYKQIGMKKKGGKQVPNCVPKESAVAEVAPPGWEKTVKAMKKHKDIDNPFALAWSMKNKGYKSHKKESIKEGGVKEILTDLRTMSDEEFQATYKMSKADARSKLKEKPVEENKKGVRAVKHTVKPRNFVAKNAVQSGAGAHKDKKKAQKQGDTKHKNKEPAYESRLWAALDRRIIK